MIGEAFDKFVVQSRLGAGGLGEVWLADHAEMHTKVAIKVLTPDASSLDAVRAALDEARRAARIADMGIAKIYDAGVRRDGRAYVITELVAGEPLARRIERGRLSATQVADVVQQVARACAVASAANVGHGNLKPSNIFMVADRERGSGERVVVVDFALGKLVTRAPELGSASYMPPEQFAGGPIDERADIYALGCIAFELACQRPPFTGKTAAQIRTKQVDNPAPAIKSLAPDIGAVLDAIVARMLERNPDLRPRSLREVAKRFEMIVGLDAPLDETKQS
jgi:serine/threonine-protein kinase